MFEYGIGFWYLMSFVFSFCVSRSAYCFLKQDKIIPVKTKVLTGIFVTSLIPVVNIFSSIILFRFARVCHTDIEKRETYKKRFKDFFKKD
jgi:hypothetical protein